MARPKTAGKAGMDERIGPGRLRRPCAAVFGSRGRGWLLAFFLVAAVAAGLAVSPDLPETVVCDCLAPLAESAPARERWRTCSDVSQAVLPESSVNVVSRPSDVDGWDCYVPADPGKPGWLAVRLRKDRDAVMFFPRLAGQGSSISVLAEDTAQQRRTIFRLTGKSAAWTPVSAQYALDLRCVRYGRASADFETVVLLRLSGGSTQIWHKNGVIFF